MDGTFTLTIDLGNDAMSDAGDLADALHRAAVTIGHAAGYEGIGGTLRDRNGNTVGEWRIAPEAAE